MGGLANFTPIARMGHHISEPKFKIPTPPPHQLIPDKSLTSFPDHALTIFPFSLINVCIRDVPTHKPEGE